MLEDDDSEPIPSHPSKNYSKIDLYDRWVRSRNEATDVRKELNVAEREARKTKKENDKLKKELEVLTGRVSTLSEKCEQSKAELMKDKKTTRMIRYQTRQ